MIGGHSRYDRIESPGFFKRRIDYIFTQRQLIQTQLETMKRYDFNVRVIPSQASAEAGEE
jgi:hypothetical protein